MGTGFLPRLKGERRTWLTNLVQKLQGAGNAYVTKYNIPAGTVTELTNGRLWVEWTFNNIDGLRAGSQSLTQFQDEVMVGKGGVSGTLGLPTAPAFTAFPKDSGDVVIPPVADVFGLAVSLAKQIKAKTNYSKADGEDLGIEGPEQPDLPPVETTAPDISKSRIGSGGLVEIVWPKKMFDGIRIEVDRGNTGGSGPTGWQLLAVDTEPNYFDTVQPASGTTAVFRYRAIYLLNDAPYGQWSQPVEITVRG